jgi:hypothetical protein
MPLKIVMFCDERYPTETTPSNCPKLVGQAFVRDVFS